MKSYGFWEECVIVMKIITTYKHELCSLRFQQLLSTSVVPKRKQYRTFDRYISEISQGETDQQLAEAVQCWFH